MIIFSVAERKTSLGKDWHGACLRCEKCNKTLNPGGHAEHEGKPYCHNPCYSAMFGPGEKIPMKSWINGYVGKYLRDGDSSPRLAKTTSGHSLFLLKSRYCGDTC
ncbi:hypothetical protein TSAR_007392 [Trichomalopsis sarcophagae]|uniref:Cysteine-rich protein 1 n=1 Tax=Trichomalopsis sarcophagae TaxID=543379 RepID=A0A232EZW3_9HYME|nr:hypothetical protein TSAR_007392 [Trichomalopsis sarcophagae]